MNPLTESTKVVYIATASDTATIFARMAAISAHSLRVFHPNANITLLTDGELSGHVWRLFPNNVSLKIVKNIPYLDPVARSRFIKTSIPEYVTPPFLFIDSDTIVASPFLSRFEGSQLDLEASYNRHRGFPAHTPAESWTRPIFDAVNAPFPPKKFFNSGVVWVNDTSNSHNFYKIWHSIWVNQVKLFNIVKDQPPFNLAIQLSSARIGSLPISMNACVGASPCFARKASIWHFTGDASKNGTRDKVLLANLVEETLKSDHIEPEILRVKIEEVRKNYRESNFVSNPVNFGPTHYLNGARKAQRVGDLEAFHYMLRERIRSKPASLRTLQLALNSWPRAVFTYLKNSKH